MCSRSEIISTHLLHFHEIFLSFFKGMDKRIPCIEVSEDFFDDDDFDVSSYGAGGDFDPRLLKQMNFADRDNNGEVVLCKKF